MKKKSGNGSTRSKDDLAISPFTRAEMKRGVMGKYYREVMAGSSIVRIAPELAKEFPNEAAVNRALRELLQLREALSGIMSTGKQKRNSA